jgi:phospholipid/cholesterol/gamma-HCH transport system substrate-binding protein
VLQSLSRVQAVILGVIVVIGLALATTGLFAVGNRQWMGGDVFHVRVGFADIAGVEVGTRVRIQGINAGEVVAVEAPSTPSGNVTLRLRLNGRLRHLVGQDARVQIQSEGMLAGKVVRILPGASGSEPVPDGALLASIPPADLSDGLAQATVKLSAALTEVQGTLQEFRQGQGPAGKLTTEMSQATSKLTNVLDQVDGQLQQFQKGEGTFGKLAKSSEVYAEALQGLQDMRRMVTSVKQNSDAIKAMPVVRSYVIDPNKELIRPDCKRYRKWFREGDLFEPGQATLTAKGRQLLDQVAPWVNEGKRNNHEVVIASFSDAVKNPDYALGLTQKQSEAVANYLKNSHSIHKTGFWWWSRRAVRTVGCGVQPSPVPEQEPLAAARVEILVFIPQE